MTWITIDNVQRAKTPKAGVRAMVEISFVYILGVLRKKSSRRSLVEAGDILLKETTFTYQVIVNIFVDKINLVNIQ